MMRPRAFMGGVRRPQSPGCPEEQASQPLAAGRLGRAGLEWQRRPQSLGGSCTQPCRALGALMVPSAP